MDVPPTDPEQLEVAALVQAPTVILPAVRSGKTAMDLVRSPVVAALSAALLILMFAATVLWAALSQPSKPRELPTELQLWSNDLTKRLDQTKGAP